jgi:23S rRNA (adenine2503-C2)-methyltransferase
VQDRLFINSEPMLDLWEQSEDELICWFSARGLPAYRAGQVRQWVLRRRALDFGEMTDLPNTLRAELANEFRLWSTRIATHRKADDGSEKLVLELADGQRIECVLLRDNDRRRTICLSTQVGCAMGCVFCASGLDGVARNLTCGEMVEQMLRLQRLLPAEERLSHIVVMGMGEPLANLDQLLPALATATSSDGLGISARRITVSTVGLPKAIRRLADQDCPYHLAVSLHAPDDQLRSRIVPASRKNGIASILAATDYYFQVTGRRVTFEYVLLAEINDRPEHARRLSELLKGRPTLVNLIPYNPVPDLPFRTPRSADTARFADLLHAVGVNAKVRYRKGDRIDAACGQLRRSVAVRE